MTRPVRNYTARVIYADRPLDMKGSRDLQRSAARHTSMRLHERIPGCVHSIPLSLLPATHWDQAGVSLISDKEDKLS